MTLFKEHFYGYFFCVLAIGVTVESRPTASLYRPHKRHGHPSKTNSCTYVREVPKAIRTTFQLPLENDIDVIPYDQYTEAYDIPVLASKAVSEDAMVRACYTLRFALAESWALRNSFYKLYGRVVVISKTEKLSRIPELALVMSDSGLDSRSHAATRDVPITVAAEENLLCHQHDYFRTEDLLLRQIVVGAFNLASHDHRPEYKETLESMYKRAMAGYKWEGTVAARSPNDYLGETVQIYFNVNGYSDPPNGRYNDISTRWKLVMYDSVITSFIIMLFPCGNHYIPRCYRTGNEPYQTLRMDCLPTPTSYFPGNDKYVLSERHTFSDNR